MTIDSLIQAVDTLYPNALSKMEKARFAYELSCQIRSEIKRLYKETVYECVSGKTYFLPEDVLFEDIVCVYENGRPIDKCDARISRTKSGSCKYCPATTGILRVVYLTRPEPYVDRELCDYTITGRIISAPGFRFRAGDTLIFTEGENEGKTCLVLSEADGGYLLSDTPKSGTYKGGCQVQRMYSTEVTPPHDSMYVDFLLAKIMFYQQDFETAAQYLAQFNAKWQAFMGAYKRTEPHSPATHLRNLW